MIEPKQIEEIFQEQLAGIEEAAIRKATIRVWVEACRAGGWQTVEDLKAVPFTLLAATKGISLIEHTIAVTEGAAGLAEAQQDAYKEMPYKISMDRLIAGSLLHDVGKLLEIEQGDKGSFRRSRAGMLARHPISGAILVAKCGLPDEIVNIVACHAKEGEGAPKVIEAVLIHQADFATFDPLLLLEKGQLIQ